MSRIEAIWLATAPLDMRAGTDSALARVVKVFSAARPHHAYLFAHARANCGKVLVHDGIGIWLYARCLHQNRFLRADASPHAQRSFLEQLSVLVLGLPWQRLGEAGVISRLARLSLLGGQRTKDKACGPRSVTAPHGQTLLPERQHPLAKIVAPIAAADQVLRFGQILHQ